MRSPSCLKVQNVSRGVNCTKCREVVLLVTRSLYMILRFQITRVIYAEYLVNEKLRHVRFVLGRGRIVKCLGRVRLVDASAGKHVRILMTFIEVTNFL